MKKIIVLAAAIVIGATGFFAHSQLAQAYLNCSQGGTNDFCYSRPCSTVGATGNECDSYGDTVSKFSCQGGSWATCNAITASGNSSIGNVATSLTGMNPNIVWNAVPGASSYDLQVSTNTAFTNLVANKNVVGTSSRVYPLATDQSASSTRLSPNTQYYFRVRTVAALAKSAWSETFSFRTMPCDPDVPPPWPGCGSGVTVGLPSSVSNKDLYSLLYSSVTWTAANGKTVFPKNVHPETRFYTDKNEEVFLTGGDQQKVQAIINGIVGNK